MSEADAKKNGSMAMSVKDLKGNEIAPECYYYSVKNGMVEEHKYVSGRKSDELRIATGRVIWCGSVNGRETARKFFEIKQIRNTIV